MVAAKLWPTVRAVEGEKGGDWQRDQAGNYQDTLTGAAKNWPTPTACDWKGSGPTLERMDGKMRGDRLDYATEQMWSTPSVADTTGTRATRSGDRSDELLMRGQAEALAAAVWPAPTSLSFADSHQPGNSRSYNTTMEKAAALAAAVWPTPSVPNGGRANAPGSLSATGTRRDGSKGQVDLNYAATFLYSLPAPETSTHGETPSPGRPSLNPRFVAWLMGWPPIGSTGFGFSETAFYPYRRRMASALSRLVSPPEAPPAQPDLFG